MPPEARPQVPEGFTAELVTTDTHKPRVIRVAPNGDLFVADSMFGAVRVLRVPAGGAKPVKDVIFASGLQQPYGIAFYPPGPNPRWVYVANSNGVVRFAYKKGDLTASGKPQRVVEGDSLGAPLRAGHRLLARTAKPVLSVGGPGLERRARHVFPEPHLTMHPSSAAVDGLEAWAKLKPLGAAWDTEELRADVLLVRSRWQEHERSSRPDWVHRCGHDDPARDGTVVVRRQRTRRPRRPTHRSNMRPMWPRGRSTAGPGTTWAPIKTHGMWVSGPTSRTRSPRRTCSCRRTRRPCR